MSRPRTIDQEAVLDAAELVVTRDGAARLTLDAVALEAGISKASVIYDYKSKQALIKAVIERRIAAEQERLRLAAEGLGPVCDVHIRARIAVLAENVQDETQAVAVNLLSALAQDAELRSMMNDSCRAELAAMIETSTNPRPSLVAFMALEGLRCLEFLGFLRLPEADRAQLLRDIEALIAEPASPMELDKRAPTPRAKSDPPGRPAALS